MNAFAQSPQQFEIATIFECNGEESQRDTLDVMNGSLYFLKQRTKASLPKSLFCHF